MPRYIQSQLVRNSATLLAGTGLSQVLLLLSSPILSRLYSPAAFGLLAAFTALNAVVSRIVTGCYEHAIMVPADDDDARGLVFLALCLAAVGSGVLLLVLIPLANQAARLFSAPDLAAAAWLASVLVFVSAAQEILNYWFNRKKRYRLLAVNRLARSGATVGAMLALGLIGPSGVRLVEATVLGTGLGAMNLAVAWFRQGQSGTSHFGRATARRLAYRYRHFAIYSAPSSLVNNLASQLPVVLLGGYFGPAVVGAFNFTQRIMGGPQALLAVAVGDVFRQRAAEDLVRSGTCRPIWRKTFGLLVVLSVPAAAVVGLFAPRMFVIVFGPQWASAGTYARLLVPYFLFALTASTLSRTLYVTERQREDLIWQIGLLLLTGGALVIGGQSGSASRTIFLYSVAYAAMYVIYLVMSYQYSQPDTQPRRTVEEVSRH